MKLTDILGRFFGGAPSGLRNKPGGLAWIRVRNCGDGGALYGHVVKTVRADAYGFWRLDPVQSYVAVRDHTDRNGTFFKAGTTCWVRGISDSALQPIGNPGEDARDETLLWLCVPSTKETA